jgi:hypothetical protein
MLYKICVLDLLFINDPLLELFFIGDLPLFPKKIKIYKSLQKIHLNKERETQQMI